MIIGKWQPSITLLFLSGIDNSHNNFIQMSLRKFGFQKALKTHHVVVNIVVNFEATYLVNFRLKKEYFQVSLIQNS